MRSGCRRVYKDIDILPTPIHSILHLHLSQSSTRFIQDQQAITSVKMYTSTLLISSLQVLSAAAAVLPRSTTEAFPAQATSLPSTGAPEYNWQTGYQSEYTIHSSCNATERHEITEGLRQAVEMAEHAKNHSKSRLRNNQDLQESC